MDDSQILERWQYIFQHYSEYMVLYVENVIRIDCGKEIVYTYHPTQEQLELFYPNQQGNLLDLFDNDMKCLAILILINYGECENSDNILQDVRHYIQDHLHFENMKRQLNNIDRQRGGAKYKYKGRAYVVRRGERSGKYILVKGKKVYLSQI